MADFRYFVFCDDSEGREVVFGTNNLVLARDYVFDEASERSLDESFFYDVFDNVEDRSVFTVDCSFVK